MEAVQLAGEREHGLAAERDDDGSGREPAERALADELERQNPLEDLDLRLGERLQHERLGVERSEQEDVPELACEQEPRPGRAALGVVRPLHLVEDEHLAQLGAISTVQQMIGAVSLTRSSPVTRPTASSPRSAARRRCASCASIRSGPA